MGKTAAEVREEERDEVVVKEEEINDVAVREEETDDVAGREEVIDNVAVIEEEKDEEESETNVNEVDNIDDRDDTVAIEDEGTVEVSLGVDSNEEILADVGTVDTEKIKMSTTIGLDSLGI